MTDRPLATDPYKGVRDFYPEDMAVQRFMFETWSKTAESFGFERYDASVLEPAELYKSKGAANEEIVNEQTYTFTDRGDREVTLRPEMTPSIARMVAKRRRELSFPLRWYAIPNLFRYERPQRGRLREHWQLNCDLFGGNEQTADIEMIALANQVMLDFGATPDMFEIRINDRQAMADLYNAIGITDPDTITEITRLNDRKAKLDPDAYRAELQTILGDDALVTQTIELIEDTSGTNDIVDGLTALGISNVRIDRTLARGFDYYTGTIFEVFDTASENRRALIGGGRYDNLTELFGGEPISGVGFGVGDVTMRDFLETHHLLPEHIRQTAARVVLIPMDESAQLYALQTAQEIRNAGFSVSVDTSNKKVGDKISRASDRGAGFVSVLGEDEMNANTLTLKHLASGEERTGTTGEIMNFLDVR